MEALEQAFLRQGQPKHPITDQDSLFTSGALRELLRHWNVRQRFDAVGRHGSVAVTERLIWTLKHDWSARVPLTSGLDYLAGLLGDFALYHDQRRGHRRLDGATPSMVREESRMNVSGLAARRARGGESWTTECLF